MKNTWRNSESTCVRISSITILQFNTDKRNSLVYYTIKACYIEMGEFFFISFFLN